MRVSLASIVSFIALLLTAIALIPAGAHVLEMSAKMKLGRDAYFVVQGLYRGWAFFGIAIVGSLLACLVRVALPGSHRERLLSLFAALMIAISLVIFFSFVYPANQATKDWTAISANWKTLRYQWEWGHVAAAACTLGAFVTLAWGGGHEGKGVMMTADRFAGLAWFGCASLRVKPGLSRRGAGWPCPTP